MTMTPSIRKLAFTAHVTFSVGWLGAVVAYLALAIHGLTSLEGPVMRAAYLAMEWIGWSVIVPLSLASLLTGLIQSFGTEWGLFRHYWILVKFLLTVGAIVILLLHMPTVSRMAAVAAETTLSSVDFRTMRTQLVVHPAGGLLVLLVATILAVYKPWGRTPYGLSKQHERAAAGVGNDRNATAGTICRRYALFGIIALLLLLGVLHLINGGGPNGH